MRAKAAVLSPRGPGPALGMAAKPSPARVPRRSAGPLARTVPVLSVKPRSPDKPVIVSTHKIVIWLPMDGLYPNWRAASILPAHPGCADTMVRDRALIEADRAMVTRGAAPKAVAGRANLIYPVRAGCPNARSERVVA